MDFYQEYRNNIRTIMEEMLVLGEFGDKYYGQYDNGLHNQLCSHLLDKLESEIKLMLVVKKSLTPKKN